MKIQAVGQSTFKVDIDNIVVLTDPCFTNSGIRYYLFMRRIYPLGIEPDSLDRCDLMLVSHNHPDHLSAASFEIARRLGTKVVGPRSVVFRAKLNRITNLCEMRPGQSCGFENLRITAIPALHPPLKNSLGFFVEGSRNLYFSGDTRFDWSIVEALQGKRIDVAFLQIACSFRTFRQGADGMDINYAVELAKAIKPKYVVPMHFDCVGRYLDLVAMKKVSEHSLEVEDALGSFQRKLSRNDIGCITLFAGNTVEFSTDKLSGDLVFSFVPQKKAPGGG